MKKIFFPVIILLVCFGFNGCIKETPDTPTPNPYMNITIGPYIFNTSTVYPSTLSQKTNDTTITLFITGEQLSTKEKIILTINNYKAKEGIYSIAAGEAEAKYLHYTGTSTIVSNTSIAIGGVVVITKIVNDNIVGYFSFQTADGLDLTNGTYTCPAPFYVAHPY